MDKHTRDKKISALEAEIERLRVGIRSNLWDVQNVFLDVKEYDVPQGAYWRLRKVRNGLRALLLLDNCWVDQE